MLHSPLLKTLLLALACAFLLTWDFALPARSAISDPPAPPAGSRDITPSPATGLALITNVGQWDAATVAVARVGRATTYLHQNGWTVALRAPPPSSSRQDATAARRAGGSIERYAVLRVTFVDCAPQVRVEPVQRLSGTVAIARFGASETWHEAVPTFAGVHYQALQPGVDLDVRTNAGTVAWQVHHESTVSLDRTRLFVVGAQRLRITAQGGLEMRTAAGTLTYGPPTATRGDDAIRCRYVMHGPFTFGFAVADRAADRGAMTTIAFALQAADMDAGSGSLQPWDDPRWPIALDASGSWVVAGAASSSDCPALPQPPDRLVTLPEETFIARLSDTHRNTRTATSVTYVRGMTANSVARVDIDGMGRIVLTGRAVTEPAGDTTLLCLDPKRSGADGLVYLHPGLRGR